MEEYKQITIDEALMIMESRKKESGQKKNVVNKKKGAKPKKQEAPDIMKEICECSSFEQLFQTGLFDAAYFEYGGSLIDVIDVIGNEVHTGRGEFFGIRNSEQFKKRTQQNALVFHQAAKRDMSYEYEADILCFDEEKEFRPWVAVVKCRMEWNLMQSGNRHCHEVTSFGVKCKPLDKVYRMPSIFQDISSLRNAMKKKNPYAYQFMEANNIDFVQFQMAPELEQIYKCGFAFAVKYFEWSGSKSQAEIDIFNRLIQYGGTSPKTIFKVPSSVYNILQKEENLRIWDAYRKLINTKKISEDVVQECVDNNFKEKDLNKVNSILAKKYKGKNIFTFTSLLHYITRLDQYEAIEREEAFQLLDDYLIACQYLEMKPKTDGDSLKREHDVAARLARQKKDEMIVQKMLEVCRETQAYNYTGDEYFIRSITSWEDLVDEAKQQHNCVAVYSEKIVKRQTMIFVMRYNNTPNVSLITIELSPNGQTIRQAYKAYNKPINNGEQTQFMEDWHKWVKEQMKGKAA